MKNDIIVKDNKIEYYFQYLDWDTHFFKTKSYNLVFEKSSLGVSEKIKNEIYEKFKNSFISAKLDTNADNLIINFLGTCGFNYIDTEVTLKCSDAKTNVLQNRPGWIIEIQDTNRNLPYHELGSSFLFTRFHSDCHIINTKADELWIEYIKNYKPDENKKIYVAREKEKIIGCILVNFAKPDVALLFFVATIKEYQGKSVSSAIISKIKEDFQHIALITETQIKNHGAMNFYIKNGFNKIIKTTTILHRWS